MSYSHTPPFLSFQAEERGRCSSHSWKEGNVELVIQHTAAEEEECSTLLLFGTDLVKKTQTQAICDLNLILIKKWNCQHI